MASSVLTMSVVRKEVDLVTICADFIDTEDGKRVCTTRILNSNVGSATSWMVASTTMTPINVGGDLWYVKMARPHYDMDGCMMGMTATLIRIRDDEPEAA